MNVRAELARGAARLAAAGIDEPARDARRLLAAALGTGADRLTPMLEAEIAAEAAVRFAAMLDARAERRPVAQITGRRMFWGRDFRVTADVLDPRPETECLVALALDGPAPARLLDLGTGSGALLVSLLAEWPAAQGTGTDASGAALAVARENAARHGVAARARFVEGDWLAPVAGVFDLIVCNPPYIGRGELATLAPEVRDWEPAAALSPGPTGLESYRAIAPALARHLAPGGRALFEIGADQGDAVMGILRDAGFADVALHRDLDGRDRVVAVALDKS